MTVLYLIFVGVLTLLAFAVVAVACVAGAAILLFGACYARELYLDKRKVRRG